MPFSKRYSIESLFHGSHEIRGLPSNYKYEKERGTLITEFSIVSHINIALILMNESGTPFVCLYVSWDAQVFRAIAMKFGIEMAYFL
jgi:hypothetical protein